MGLFDGVLGDSSEPAELPQQGTGVWADADARDRLLPVLHTTSSPRCSSWL